MCASGRRLAAAPSPRRSGWQASEREREREIARPIVCARGRPTVRRRQLSATHSNEFTQPPPLAASSEAARGPILLLLFPLRHFAAAPPRDAWRAQIVATWRRALYQLAGRRRNDWRRRCTISANRRCAEFHRSMSRSVLPVDADELLAGAGAAKQSRRNGVSHAKVAAALAAPHAPTSCAVSGRVPFRTSAAPPPPPPS